MPDVSGRGKGDLLATVQVLTPKKLTKEQRQLLEQLGKVLPKEKFEPRTHGDEHEDRNLFDRVKDMFG
jgi:DnaJ-class molecular chaperone